MYTLLVVDDEEWIRDRIIKTIDWEKSGIRCVIEASNGTDALEIIKEFHPDIIILDIRMPDLSGLDIVQALKEKSLNAKVIFLSGYDDFEYAQRAVKLGAFDYILKPAENRELVEAVEKCIELIRQQENISNMLDGFEGKLQNFMPALKEHFFSDLINGYIDETSLQGDLDFLEVPSTGLNYICLSVLPCEDLHADADSFRVLLNIKKDMKKLTEQAGYSEVLFQQDGSFACVICSKMEEKNFKNRTVQTGESICDLVKERYQQRVSVGVGEVCGSIVEICDSFQQSQLALSYRTYLGNDKVFTVESLADTIPTPISFDYNYLEKLILSVKQGDNKQSFALVSSMMEQFEAERFKLIDLKSSYTHVISSIVQSSYELVNINQETPSYGIDFFTYLDTIKDLESLGNSLMSMIEILIENLKKTRKSEKRKVINTAISYIEENFNKPLTLCEVANHVYLNQSYFCKLFKAQTGTTFTKFLTNYRMDKAVELMRDPAIKIYEIAEKVGYKDVQYFTKLFKGVKGSSPSIFREKVK